MAEKGRGKRIRFQGGTLFPVMMVVIVAIGLGLVGYARATAGDQAQGARANANWHIAFGIYHCTAYVDPIKALATAPTNGVTTQGDGVIYYDPTDSSVSGGKANLSVYLANYAVVAGSSTLTTSSADGSLALDASKDKCNNKSAELRTYVWKDATKPGDFSVVNSGNRSDVRITNDNMAIGVFFVDPTSDAAKNPPQPPSVAKLAALNGTATTSSTVAGTATTTAGTTIGTTAGTTVGSVATTGSSATTGVATTAAASATTGASATTAAPAVTATTAG